MIIGTFLPPVATLEISIDVLSLLRPDAIIKLFAPSFFPTCDHSVTTIQLQLVSQHILTG